jgi:ribulose-phosphate 3-epimerase
MDGHFVPNLTYGPVVIESLRKLTTLPLDAHLMISDPARYLDDFVDAGCDAITVHYEALENPAPLLRRIRDAHVAAGLAVNPKTPVAAVESLLSECDLVLVMSVEPGFGGQKFIPTALEKLCWLTRRMSLEAVLAVDGGISAENIGSCAAAGAKFFVVGSAIFESGDYRRALTELGEIAASHPVSPACEN